MGGTVSKSTSEMINDMATNVLTSTLMNCMTTATQNQLLQFSNIKGNLDINSSNLTQASTFDVSCILSATNTQDMSNSIANVIAQVAESKGQAALSALGNTKADIVSDISNKISNNITNMSKTDVVNILTQGQQFVVDGITGNVTLANVSLSQQATVVSRAIVTSSAIASVVNSASSKIDQTAKSTETNPIADMINSVGTAIGSIFGSPGGIIIMVVGLLVLSIVAYYFFEYRKSAMNVATSALTQTSNIVVHK